MTLPLRRIVFWLHLSAGLIAGAVILMMSATGVLLAYEEQIVDWAERGYLGAEPDPGASRPRLDELAATAAEAVGDAAPTAVTLRADPRAPIEVSFGRRRSLYLDPATGRVLGAGAESVRATLRAVTDWHRWLGRAGDGRAVGRAITGAANLAFLCLVLSGLYLWVPRTWSRLQVRNVAWFRRGLSTKARDFNWHHVIGLWIALPLVAIVASGVVMSYPWANRLLYRAAGEAPPAARGRGPGEAPRGDRGETQPPAADLSVLEPAADAAARHVPGWRAISMQLPDGDRQVVATVTRGGRGRPDLRQRLTFDPASGEVVEVESFADQSRGRRLRTWVRWIHTGEAGGLPGQTVAAVASGGAAFLVWTGVALAWRRLVPRRWRRRSSARPSPELGAAPRAATGSATAYNPVARGEHDPRKDGEP